MAKMTPQQRAKQKAGIANAKRAEPSKYAGRKKGTIRLSGDQIKAMLAEILAVDRAYYEYGSRP